MRRLAAMAAIAVLAMPAQAQSLMKVTVVGRVAQAGEITFQGEPRLSDVVIAAKVERDAYVLGAAWLRPGLQLEQTRLREGLLYQLAWIEKAGTAKKGREPLAVLARRLHAWIASLPVTGRQVVRTLEPHALQVSRQDNRPVADGDHLEYPSRPSTVSVVGAVEQACSLPQIALQDVRGYVLQCAHSPFADPDWVWVIEPDGNVSQVGISLWNRSADTPVAPGAILYVPIEPRAIARAADAGFNHDMAAFLATQPVGGSGANE